MRWSLLLLFGGLTKERAMMVLRPAKAILIVFWDDGCELVEELCMVSGRKRRVE